MDENAPEADAPAPLLPDLPEAAAPVFAAVLDADGVVKAVTRSNLLGEGAVVLDEATFLAASGKLGRCKFVDGALVDYAPPATAPLPAPIQDEISPRQFYEEAAVENIISKAEALAFMVSKTLPKILADPIAQLPDDQQFSVMMALTGTAYSRSSPFTNLVGQLIGKDATAMDTFWRAAAAR